MGDVKNVNSLDSVDSVNASLGVCGSGHAHDVTGGMNQKLISARCIAASRVPVYIINRHEPNLSDVMLNGARPEIGTTVRCFDESAIWIH